MDDDKPSQAAPVQTSSDVESCGCSCGFILGCLFTVALTWLLSRWSH